MTIPSKIPPPFRDVSPWTVAGMRKWPSVIPVVGCIVLGCALATAYTLRLALFNPDVTWNSKKKPHPQNDYDRREYKFFTKEPFDVSTYEHPRPKF